MAPLTSRGADEEPLHHQNVKRHKDQMAYQLAEEQKETLESERDWRYQLSVGDEVEIVYWPTESYSTGTVSGVDRHEIEVDAASAKKEFSFDRETGVGTSGARKEDEQVIDRYAIRKVGARKAR